MHKKDVIENKETKHYINYIDFLKNKKINVTSLCQQKHIFPEKGKHFLCNYKADFLNLNFEY